MRSASTIRRNFGMPAHSGRLLDIEPRRQAANTYQDEREHGSRYP